MRARERGIIRWEQVDVDRGVCRNETHLRYNYGFRQCLHCINYARVRPDPEKRDEIYCRAHDPAHRAQVKERRAERERVAREQKRWQKFKENFYHGVALAQARAMR